MSQLFYRDVLDRFVDGILRLSSNRLSCSKSPDSSEHMLGVRMWEDKLVGVGVEEVEEVVVLDSMWGHTMVDKFEPAGVGVVA